MAVVIHDFEVPVEPAPKPASTGAGAGPNSAPPPGPTPQDIARILRRQRERLLRVWAS